MDTLVLSSVEDRLIFGEGTSKLTWQAWKGLDTLPELDIAQCFPPQHRVIIIAPHPDDEILGCAGLIQKLDQYNREILLVAVTNGTQSHPDSSIYSPKQLNQIRPQESYKAFAALNLKQQVKRIELNIMDGKVPDFSNQLYKALSKMIKADDILICTYEKDGHPDHEATGHITKRIADEHALLCYRVLIWTWHWATPDDSRISWQNAYKIILTPAEIELKRKAISCFKSQCEIDPSTGQLPILSVLTIERILQPLEVYLHG